MPDDALFAENTTPDGVDQHIVRMIAKPTHTAPVANLLMQKYGDRVICDENDQWFHVPDGDYRWNSKVTRPYLKSKMEGEVNKLFQARAPHDFFYGNHPAAKVPYNQVQDGLCTNRHQNEIAAAFAKDSAQQHPKFGERLDENHFLIGFNNGVIELARPEDLVGGELVGDWAGTPGWRFRPGTPSDMISMSVGYAFEEDWTTASAYQEQYDMFLGKVFKGEEMDHYKLVCAWILCGNLSIRRKFLLLVGHGGNSKSKQGNLLQHALGDYAYTSMSSQALQVSGKTRHDEEHSTKLAGMKGKRVAVASEPSKRCPYDQNHIKKLTGGDAISARPAFGKASDIVTFISQASLAQLLNFSDFPLIEHDPAFDKRADVLPMKSTFGQRPDKSIITEDDDEKREYKEDTSIDMLMPYFKFCWLKAALAAYKDFLANPLFEFAHSKEAWNEMCGQQSAVGTFFSDEVVHVTREVYDGLDPGMRRSRIDQYHYSLDEMFDDFQDWKFKQTKRAFTDDATTKRQFTERVLSAFPGFVTAQNRRLSGHSRRVAIEREAALGPFE